MVLVFELRTSCLLGRFSATWTMPPSHFYSRYFSDRVSWFLLGWPETATLSLRLGSCHHPQLDLKLLSWHLCLLSRRVGTTGMRHNNWQCIDPPTPFPTSFPSHWCQLLPGRTCSLICKRKKMTFFFNIHTQGVSLWELKLSSALIFFFIDIFKEVFFHYWFSLLSFCFNLADSTCNASYYFSPFAGFNFLFPP
jgi:hypothetical protein